MDKRVKNRIELGVHTNMSAWDGVNTAEEYVKATFDNFIPAIAITDHASVQAFSEAYNASKKLNYDVKIIYGIESTYIRENGGRKDRYNISILAKNKQGLKDLYQLVSDAHTKFFDKCAIMPLEEIEKYRENLIVGSDGFGELFLAVVNGEPEKKVMEIAFFYDYLKVHPLEYYPNYIENGYIKDEEELKGIVKKIIEVGEKLGKVVVATDDCHYIYSEDGECRKILQYKKGYENYNSQPNLYLRNTEEMLAEFAFLGEEKAYEIVVENTQRIASVVDDTFEPFTQEKEYPQIDDAEAEVCEQAYKSAEKQYGGVLPAFVEERIKWEIEKIKKNGYAGLYFIAAEMTKFAKEKEYVVGNRGGIASSLVVYLLGITEINPLAPHYYCPECGYSELHQEEFCGSDMSDKICPMCGEMLLKDGFNIPAETFMGEDGDKEPDINLNFAPEIREEVQNKLADLIGAEKIVRAGTICTISKAEAEKSIIEYCKENKIKYSPEKINKMADKISNIKRTTGMHPGTVFIIPDGKDVTDYTPVQYPANNKECGFITTHFDAFSLNKSLRKVNILAHETPSLLYRLEKLTGVNSATIPLNDEKTIKLFNTGKTCGIPEFNTVLARSIIRKTGVKSFDDLIRISGFIHGTDVWFNNGEDNIDKAGLSGIISCRDDITLYLERKGFDRKAAFKIAEDVRKGKGITTEVCVEMSDKGIPDWYIDSCNAIKYLFPRAHCASYVLIAYRVAYYKAHYPLEFYCSYFSINADRFDSDLLVNNADVLYQEIERFKNSEESHFNTQKLDMMEVCQEMYDSGFEFVSDSIKNESFDCFFIEDGKLRPKLRYN